MKLLPVLLLVAILVAGCGSGTPTTQTRSVGAFDRLEVSGDVNVDVVPGDSGDIEVTAGEKVIDRVVTEVSGGVLRVHIRDRGIVIGPDPFDNVRVQVAAGSLDGIRIEGSSDLKLGRIDRDELSIEVNGSGDIEASGTVGNLTTTIEGAGDAHLFDLEAKTATVTVQGAGDIRYRGNPSIHQTIEGAGDIRPAD